jgi:dihydrofolate reductase
MSSVISHITVSVDGFAAGPRQSLSAPLGEGAMDLHTWLVSTAAFRGTHGSGSSDPASDRGDDPDEAAAVAMSAGVGAYVMGRNMFSPGRGSWDLSWRGWWGEEPPFRVPVFVLTHYEREPLVMEGGTVFSFVTGGVADALALAREAAGDRSVHVAGGASTVQQFLRAGLLDELHLHISPLVLGDGERLLVDVGQPVLEPFAASGSSKATHVSYRVIR